MAHLLEWLEGLKKHGCFNPCLVANSGGASVNRRGITRSARNERSEIKEERGNLLTGAGGEALST
ncbi:MAG: hypothetical protein JNL70_06845 [Saprospiraceae bacterium]|nr:hypothetical protein [Saprospiraceae bacterium]